jgi:FKBP-type peptidyl-prolyl cis-trans isomerase
MADSLSLLLTLFMLPGYEALAPMDLGVEGSSLYFDERLGSGPPLQVGDQVTFHYQILSGDGKVLACSRTRGLDFTASLEPSGEVPSLISGLIGVRSGGERRIFTQWKVLGGAQGEASGEGEVQVRVKVLSVVPLTAQR